MDDNIYPILFICTFVTKSTLIICKHISINKRSGSLVVSTMYQHREITYQCNLADLFSKFDRPCSKKVYRLVLSVLIAIHMLVLPENTLWDTNEPLYNITTRLSVEHAFAIGLLTAVVIGRDFRKRSIGQVLAACMHHQGSLSI